MMPAAYMNARGLLLINRPDSHIYIAQIDHSSAPLACMRQNTSRQKSLYYLRGNGQIIID